MHKIANTFKNAQHQIKILVFLDSLEGAKFYWYTEFMITQTGSWPIWILQKLFFPLLLLQILSTVTISTIIKFGRENWETSVNKSCVSFFFFCYYGQFIHNDQTNLMVQSANRMWGHTSATVWWILAKLCIWVKGIVLKNSKKIFFLSPL